MSQDKPAAASCASLWRKQSGSELLARTSPEDALLESPEEPRKLTPQRPATRGSGLAISWLFVERDLARPVVLRAYRMIGRRALLHSRLCCD